MGLTTLAPAAAADRLVVGLSRVIHHRRIYTVYLCKVEVVCHRPTFNDVPSSVARAPSPRRPGRPDLEHMARRPGCRGGGGAVLRATQPFEHGIWLVAYLFLSASWPSCCSGAVRRRCFRLPGLPGPWPVRRRAEFVLWNFGVVIVPVGVLAETRLAVLIGTMALARSVGFVLRRCATTSQRRPQRCRGPLLFGAVGFHGGQRHHWLGLGLGYPLELDAREFGRWLKMGDKHPSLTASPGSTLAACQPKPLSTLLTTIFDAAGPRARPADHHH